MNPQFELDQICRYITHLQQNPSGLRDTVESHFFPVLQRIFLREGLEVVRDKVVNNRRFPFFLKDLDCRRPDIVVDFAYQTSLDLPVSLLPGFVSEWASAAQAGQYSQSLLILRNHPLAPSHKRILDEYNRAIRFLDFDLLKQYATHAFEAFKTRQEQRAVVLVIDLLDKLIEAIAQHQTLPTELHWFDIERMFFRILRGLGFYAHQTPSTKDGGRDVLACEILIDDVHWYNVEIKHWTNKKVGAEPTRRTLETALREGRRGALLLSTSGVTPSAVKVRTELHQDYLRFADDRKLITSCKHLTQARSGIWNTHGTLRSFLFSETT